MNKNESSEVVRLRKQLAQELVKSEKHLADLVLAQRALSFQKAERDRLMAALDAINQGVIFSNTEKEKRAAELQLANVELAYQNEEKGKRAAELVIANAELIFQNTEKEKRAAELGLANVELAYQNAEKSKRAAELVIAYTELIHQNTEKEKRSAELLIANAALVFNNSEKEKRANELILINAELEAFTYISSHDLHEPLRKICTFVDRILDTENEKLSPRGKDYFNRIHSSATHMQMLIDDLLAFSRLKTVEPEKLTVVNLNEMTAEVVKHLKPLVDAKSATVDVAADCEIRCNPVQLRLALHSLISNSLKFSAPDRVPHIVIRASLVLGSDASSTLSADLTYCYITLSDNGIGFDPQHQHKIFNVFQRLHGKSVYEGSGIGLAIVKRIVETHRGAIHAVSEAGTGTTFHIFMPV